MRHLAGGVHAQSWVLGNHAADPLTAQGYTDLLIENATTFNIAQLYVSAVNETAWAGTNLGLSTYLSMERLLFAAFVREHTISESSIEALLPDVE